MKTIIYGASDDLIIMDGGIDEELDYYKEPAAKCEASDGTKFKIQFTGRWEIIDIKGGDLFEKFVAGTEEGLNCSDEDVMAIQKDVPPHSDVILFKEGLAWIKINRNKFKPLK